MSTLLREVIRIPERAGADDYVLRLTEGVGRDRLAATVAEYVVTDALAEATSQALDLVAASLRDGQSRAAFLAGSFGSGKSHFMAVLHALLGHDPTARAKPELAPVIAAYDGALREARVLRLAYHFLESQSVEQTVLGGYVAQIQALHPGCDLPAVHRGDAVIGDGEKMRLNLGDDAFFAQLNAQGAGAAGGDVWSGVLEAATVWDAGSYDAARAAAPGSEQRLALVSALVRAYFTAYTQTAEFVSLDEGLAAVTRHAKSLGYDAVVLLLDELVLWLAFSVRDREKFGREAQKLTKLVESQYGPRAVPVVSFVARQMDLRRYFAESGAGAGAEQEALDSALRHQEGRFATIVLGDDNLPYVAQKRLLQPVDQTARAVLDDAFARLDRRGEVWDTLLDGVNTDERHRGSDQAEFRRTYPFSPALVSTLRTLASAMQRDRTALKVMQQLLVDQRDTLTVDDVVPVGDVFDLVVEGSQAITPELATRFRMARALYQDKLRPLLLREHSLDEAAAGSLPGGHPFRADDRLVKTLVLAAVAPTVPALKELTAGRLAALNHGSIVSPLPGQEAALVLRKVQRWAAEVPEIHVTGGVRDPVIRVRLSEVDYESVVTSARGEDNDGRRRELLKGLVWEAFGIGDRDGDAFGVYRQATVWRGSRREVELVFGNVRDTSWLTEDHFRAGPGTWRFVVDYPFDEDGRSSQEDIARLEELRDRGLVTSTVAWVPWFLSRERQDDLGRLVILDWLLSGPGDRWRSHAQNLAETDRAAARTILESQRDALRDRLRRAVQEAYGAATPTPGTLQPDEDRDKVLVSLDPSFPPGGPVGTDLAAAFGHLVDLAFSATYPAHPRFEPEDKEVRGPEITAVLRAVEAASQDRDGRVFVETRDRAAVRRVANPLGVGHMGETHFQFGADRFAWALRLERAMGRAGIPDGGAVTVEQLRGWIAAEEPRYGLRAEVADLVIGAWAVLRNRAWYRAGSPVVPRPEPGRVGSELELRPEPLPTAGDWELATRRVQSIFGVLANRYLTGAAVAELAEQVRERVRPLGGTAGSLVDRLERAYRELRLDAATPTGRLATARAAASLLRALASARDPVALVGVLARAELPATDQAVATSLSSADAVASAVEGFPWSRLRPLLAARRQPDSRGRDAKAVLDRLDAAVSADELAQRLAPALQRADQEAYDWVAVPVLVAEPPAGGADPPPSPSSRASRIIATAAELTAAVDELRSFVREHAGEAVVVEWRLRR